MGLEGDHRHCRVCGRVTKSLDDETCSKACRSQRAQQLQIRRGLMYLLYASAALLLIVFLTRLFI